MPPEDKPASGLLVFKCVFLYVIHAFTWIGEVVLHTGHGWLYPQTAVRMIAVALPYGWFMLWSEKVRRQGYADDLTYLALLPVALFWLMAAQWVISILVRRRTYSHYTGFPLLKLVVPFCGGVFVKEWLQPGLIMAASWWFYRWNRPLLSFCMAIGVSMFLVGRLRSMQEMFREQGFTDAIHKPWY